MPLPSSDEDWLASALRASARAADGNAKLLRVFSWQAFECSRLGTAAASRTVGPIAELDVLLALFPGSDGRLASIQEALSLLRAGGHGVLASRLQRRSRARNGAAHTDPRLAADIERALGVGAMASPTSLAAEIKHKLLTGGTLAPTDVASDHGAQALASAPSSRAAEVEDTPPPEDHELLNYPAKHCSGTDHAVESIVSRRVDTCSERTVCGDSDTADGAVQCEASDEQPPASSQVPSRDVGMPVGRVQVAPTVALPTGEAAFHTQTDLGTQSHLAPHPVARTPPCAEFEDYKNRIKQIFCQHNPTMLADLDSLLAAHKDREYILYITMCNKYKVGLQPMHPGTLARLGGDLARDSDPGLDIQRTGFGPLASSKRTPGVPSLGFDDGGDDARSSGGPLAAPVGGRLLPGRERPDLPGTSPGKAFGKRLRQRKGPSSR